jgi:hypothetical protein|tara:strand:- start:344 stop:838 length:495 start_codon:yes stop_codon:yes gene_type:complete
VLGDIQEQAAADIAAHEAMRNVVSLFVFTLVMLSGCSREAVSIEFVNARVRTPLPGQDKSVGYARLHNHTSEAVTLVAAHSEGVRAIEFHTTIYDGDVVRMQRLKDISIPAGGEAVFEPGGAHLMLFGMHADFSEKRDLRVTFTTADGRGYGHAFTVVDVVEFD